MHPPPPPALGRGRGLKISEKIFAGGFRSFNVGGGGGGGGGEGVGVT